MGHLKIGRTFWTEMWATKIDTEKMDGNMGHRKIGRNKLDGNTGHRTIGRPKIGRNWGPARAEIGRTNWTDFRSPIKHPRTCDTRMCFDILLIYVQILAYRTVEASTY